MENQLRQLYEQLRCDESLEAELKRTVADQTQWQNRLKEAEKRLCYERWDVERLEKRSIKNTLYRLSGKLEDRLERERGDVSAAQEEYEKAQNALQACNERVDALKRKQMGRVEAQHHFEQQLDAKRVCLQQAGDETALEMACREQVVRDYTQRLQELHEADRAGRRALAAADQALHCLDSADGFATWDLLGGGLMADLAKHSRLDEAQQYMAALQSQLKQFEKELGDVAIHGAIQVNVEGFLRLADYWFDNFFTDWAMKSRIEESLNQVRQIRQEIEKLLRRMEQMKYETQRQEAYARQELREWLIDVPLPEA